MNEAQVGILGYERGIFDRRYVALVPGIRWLPAAGVDVGRDDPRTRRTDYFRVALDVELPSTWLAAGPGKRQTVGSAGDRTTFRFAPQPAVPEVALMAAELESFATEIDGITFEVLVHPDHDRNFEVLAHARAEIEQWVAERLELARDAGLALSVRRVHGRRSPEHVAQLQRRLAPRHGTCAPGDDAAARDELPDVALRFRRHRRYSSPAGAITTRKAGGAHRPRSPREFLRQRPIRRQHPGRCGAFVLHASDVRGRARRDRHRLRARGSCDAARVRPAQLLLGPHVHEHQSGRRGRHQ